jgi:ADP-heptose:LPS heptosyltransferase
MRFGFITLPISAALKLIVSRPSDKDLSSARRFLFLHYESALGAAVLATPVFEALKRQMPDAFVAVAASGLSYQTLENNPYIDHIYETPHPLKHFGATLWYFLTVVRKQRRSFDCIVCNVESGRLKITLLALLSGIQWRIGYEGSIRFFHRSLTRRPGESFIAENLRVLGLLGYACEELEPKIFFTQRDLQFAQDFINNNGIMENRPVIAMITGTNGGEPNAWFSDRFAELSSVLIRRYNAQLIFVGAKCDQPEVERIRQMKREKTYSAVGLTDVSQLAALFSQCDFAITVDTGAFHVARAVRLPCVVIAPAHNQRFEWLPRPCSLFQILRREDICCRQKECIKRECMAAIGVHDAVAAFDGLFKTFPASDNNKRIRCNLLTLT